MVASTTKAEARQLDGVRHPLAGDPQIVGSIRALGILMARRKGLDRHADDLAGAALLGLAEAAASFEEGMGASFRTHAFNRARGAVLDEIRRIANGGLAGWNSRRGASAPVEAAGLADELVDAVLPVGWEIESEDAVRARLAALGRDGEVLADYLLRADCRTLDGLGVLHGLSGRRAGEITMRAFDRLRAEGRRSPAETHHSPAPACGCGRPISAASTSGRCISCGRRERSRQDRERLRAEVDRRIAAVLGR
jgi:hypothetical protein